MIKLIFSLDLLFGFLAEINLHYEIKMKKPLLIIIVSAVFATVGAYAQERRVSTRSECTQRCNASLPVDVPKYSEQLRKVRAEKEKETDPKKLQELERKEKEETEKMYDKVEQVCRDICQYNPD
ncbi:hypothetical protein [Undibacterium umbellatum]|uniref:Uncharacterized protein n=1 Tax=Undibacterium umbellatum TaxID=2762300 RepID=A0ABR6ZHV2_9BURK|nr:hypothetical protein [Undibacterium umbellatum]MBC3911299.1 hypothetical protein [Undibacterium umbellatum]